MSVAEESGEVVFLHKIVQGGADRSYGVHVARLAGMPRDVVSRAWDLLKELEGEAELSGSNGGYQLNMLVEDHQERKLDKAALQELRNLDLESMTPLDAINALARLQEQLTDQSD